MATSDDLRDLRNWTDRLTLAIDRQAASGPGANRHYLGQVAAAPPKGSSAPIYVDTYPLTASGNMAAGLAATFATNTNLTVPVIVFGQVPSAGQNLICRNHRGRWRAYLPSPANTNPGQGSTDNPPMCFCTQVPSVLTMLSGSPTCNFNMFQSCTIAYQAIPGFYAELDLGSMAYLSDEFFPDPLADGAMFQYMLTCNYNQFGLTRLYPQSPYGSPFRDAVLYTWFAIPTGSGGGALGAQSNYCSPGQLHLNSGVVYPGSDPTCYVTINGG